MANEVWKTIKNYEGFYEVSSEGRVRSVERLDARGQHRKSKTISANSIQQVSLCKDGKRKNFLVHKLVADAFLEAPQSDEKLIHVDGNPKRKRNVYYFEDNKTGEVFEGSINDCANAWGITKACLLCRANKGRVTKTLIGVQGLRTFTNIETGDAFHGTKQQARAYFHVSWNTLYDKINSGLIQMFPPDDEPTNSEDKISGPKTKRLLNQYYLRKANELGL